jgi:hypothetical protein
LALLQTINLIAPFRRLPAFHIGKASTPYPNRDRASQGHPVRSFFVKTEIPPAKRRKLPAAVARRLDEGGAYAYAYANARRERVRISVSVSISVRVPHLAFPRLSSSPMRRRWPFVADSVRPNRPARAGYPVDKRKPPWILLDPRRRVGDPYTGIRPEVQRPSLMTSCVRSASSCSRCV